MYVKIKIMSGKTQNKVNYQKILENTLGALKINYKQSGKIPKLLLHSCCGPCSSYVLSYLKSFFEIYVLFYNPNIYPADEFNIRKKEQFRLLTYPEFKNIKFINSDYNSDDFFNAIKGWETEKEGGKRCEICYKLRLKKAAETAKKLNIQYFSTTLTVSLYKNAEKINYLGTELEEAANVKYLLADFKKKDGYKKSIELSRKYNLYRQNYCGCVFSNKKTIQDQCKL